MLHLLLEGGFYYGKSKKDSLSTLFSEEVHGPFVTFLFNTHVAHQNVEKDSLVLKNFAKAAKTRFEKKFPEEKWSVFQEKLTHF